MTAILRISILILVLGVSVAVGTLSEGAFPLSILDGPTYQVQGDTYHSVVANRLLFARNYLLSVHVSEGGPVDVLLYDISGQFRFVMNAVMNSVKYGALPFRGMFNLSVLNHNSSSTRLRVSLLQYGMDQQQMLLAETLFVIGFIPSLIYAVRGWFTTSSSSEEPAQAEDN